MKRLSLKTAIFLVVSQNSFKLNDKMGNYKLNDKMRMKSFVGFIERYSCCFLKLLSIGTLRWWGNFSLHKHFKN